jgi:hypothetical protein
MQWSAPTASVHLSDLLALPVLPLSILIAPFLAISRPSEALIFLVLFEPDLAVLIPVVDQSLPGYPLHVLPFSEFQGRGTIHLLILQQVRKTG